jgi:hypothetical protein
MMMTIRTDRSSPVLLVLVAVVLLAGLMLMGCQKETGKSFNLKGKETREVLNPAMFTGQTRMAYAEAQKYPEVLNEVYCYCFCDEPPFNHKTLLSCFVTKHGAG